MNKWMMAAGAAVLLCGLAGPASAQMGDALGVPLPMSDMDPGTVSVRVVDGALSKPVVGIDVQLVSPDGGARTARTDAEGRATFVKLQSGKRYKARVVTEDERSPDGSGLKNTESQEFAVPSSGGLRLLISTSPWQGGDGPAMPAGPAAGMPDPRQMSGISRPQQGDPPGQLTIRVVRGQMSDNVPDHPVELIGYGSDGSITRLSQRTDAGGRAVFSDLVSDKVAYYALTVLPRQVGATTVYDRLRSSAIMMPPQVGMRLMLAGEVATSGKPAVEDLERDRPGLGQPDAGQAVVEIFGQIGSVRALSLFEVTDGAPRQVAQARITAGRPTQVQGEVGAGEPQNGMAGGTLAVSVARAAGQRSVPVAGTEVVVEPVDAEPTAAPVSQLTSNGGLAVFTGLAPGGQYRVVARVHGTPIMGAPFTLPDSGGLRVEVSVAWRDPAGGQALFDDLSTDPGVVYYAAAESGAQRFTSIPFQPSADRGSRVPMMVLDGLKNQVTFSFHNEGKVDDAYLGFWTQMTIRNYDNAPWDPGLDGLLIPLPEGFIGGVVGEQWTHRVSVDPDQGFIWRGSVPPGGVQFEGGFSVPIVDGQANYDMALPMGTMNSLLLLQSTPGMKLDLPSDVAQRTWNAPNGDPYRVIQNIFINPGRRMVMTVRNLPQRPAWEGHVKVAVGIVVLALLAWGFGGAYLSRRRAKAHAGGGRAAERRSLEQHRRKLLDDLAALELEKGGMADKEYRKRKGKLTRKLETIYAQLEERDAPPRARA
ncbi:hypothetical protein [Haliangium sp.]|uniref:hypothetical protein n=1 Tax=Haliangium sp. TaxID=2663208 RepID=UPI003D0EA25F